MLLPPLSPIYITMAQPSDQMNNSSTISALKRRIAGLEKENHDLRDAETPTQKSCMYHSPLFRWSVHVDVAFADARSSTTVLGV